MTGEMSWIKSDGTASDGSVYSIHAAIAKAVRGKLRPFDTYIGPYISTPEGKLFLDYDGAQARAVLWVGGSAPAYREPIVSDATFYPYEEGPECAIYAAREVLKRARKLRKQ